MKNKQKGFVVPLLIGLIALLTAGGLYYYTSSPPASAYNDKDFGVKFQVPAGWMRINFTTPMGDTVGAGKTIGYSFKDYPNHDGQFEITKTVDTGKPLGSTSLYYKNDAYEKEGVVQGAATFAGLPGYKITTPGVFEKYSNGKPDGNKIPTQYQYWYVNANGNNYEIVLESTADYYNKNQTLISNLLNSVQFIK